MTDSAIIVSILSLPLGLVIILFQAALWQRKEYRLDRMRAAFIDKEFTKNTFFYLISIAGFLTALLFDNPAFIFLALASLYANYLIQIFTKGISRPQSTLKVKLLVLASLLFLTTTSLITYPSIVGMTAQLIVLPISISLLTFLINLLTNPRKRQIISKAKKIRSDLENISVIGITGSYGKTSTKHFLSQLLPTAVPSDQHRNSELAIAQDIIQQLSSKTTTYITELGAYKKGEISALVDLVKPDIGILASIGNQHLSLFGSQQNIIDAKWELIEGLPPNGIAILNADDSNIISRSKGYQGKVIWYSVKKPADVYASEIKVLPKQISFQLHHQDQTIPVTVPVAGLGALSNILASIAGAIAHGSTLAEIKELLVNLKAFPRTMEIVTTSSGATIIDDSYSANVSGVINALRHLKQFPELDKRIVMTPLIELGSQASQAHQEIGQELQALKAPTFIYHKKYTNQLSESGSNQQVHFYSDANDLIANATKDITSETVILIEGRVPEIIRQSIL